MSNIKRIDQALDSIRTHMERYGLPIDVCCFLERARSDVRLADLLKKLSDHEPGRVDEWLCLSVQAACNLGLLAAPVRDFDEYRNKIEEDLADRAKAARVLATEKDERRDLIEPRLRAILDGMPDLAAYFETRLSEFRRGAGEHSGSSRKKDAGIQLSVMISVFSNTKLGDPSDEATAELLGLILDPDAIQDPIQPETVRKRWERDLERRRAGSAR